MNTFFLRIQLQIGQLIQDEEGQDLVEYALIVALIAFSSITSMGYLAKGINHAFSGLATTLTANV
jgi:pilus assembly protein Flp/PilA